MVTGRYNFRNWVELGVLADTEKPSATQLKNAGYATCLPVNGSSMVAMGIKNHGFDKYRVFMPYDPKTHWAMATGNLSPL